ncbi:unnamed protein product [Phaedon cochleariae]|uniref:Major facilitator superfamily (MFS) profile domain-containing protein n=1 Tax=Phaedon cochleariae TaxID=80249 RepID=A0A9P0DYR8_PHACE|nr:unnamed protein product [Phaedon cochleariae]
MEGEGEKTSDLKTVSQLVENESAGIGMNGTKLVSGEVDEIKSSKKKFSNRQKGCMLMLALADFMSFCSMSIMAPFYPKEAANKGMTESMAGVVFGYYAMIVFLSSPIIGKILPKVGVKFVFTGGFLISGISSVAFGSLYLIQDYNTFTILSFVIRGFQALGSSAYSTAGFVLVINIFPDHAATVRGILETFVGLGLSAGPAIGGILFAFGGFGLPFYVIGLLMIVVSPLNICVLPPAEKCPIGTKSGSLTSVLRLTPVIITCFIMVVVSMTWGFLDPTLEPYLRKFDLSPTYVGLIFLLCSAMYGIFCPIWGWCTDKVYNYWWFMIVGLFGNSIVLLILGPSPILYFLDGSLTTVIATLSTLGVFVAMALMPTYQYILDTALGYGYADDLMTHSVIAGLWSSVFSLGEILGPMIGGTLMQHYKFPIACTFFAALNLFMGILCSVYFWYSNKSTVINLEVIKNGVKKLSVSKKKESSSSNAQNTTSVEKSDEPSIEK